MRKKEIEVCINLPQHLKVLTRGILNFKTQLECPPSKPLPSEEKIDQVLDLAALNMELIELQRRVQKRINQHLNY